MLSIRNLTVTVGATPILNQVSIDVPDGKIVGIVGGSGSGKTTLGLSILRLLPTAMTIQSGQILLNQTDLLKIPTETMRITRGKEIGMIFQEPLSAFDPLFTIGFQLDETLRAHTPFNASERQTRILETLTQVEIDDPGRIANSYPHQLSGGLRQRAMIAQAMICKPKFIIADEPTSSLDVTIQARVLALLKKINKEQGVTIVLIAHDLGLVSFMAEEVAVMNEGRIVEHGVTQEILKHPQHAYTKELMKAYL